MNHATIYNCTIFDKQIAEPLDASAVTKLDFSDEHPQCNQPRIVRVQFAETSDSQVFVGRRSQDKQ